MAPSGSRCTAVAFTIGPYEWLLRAFFTDEAAGIGLGGPYGPHACSLQSGS